MKQPTRPPSKRRRRGGPNSVPPAPSQLPNTAQKALLPSDDNLQVFDTTRSGDATSPRGSDTLHVQVSPQPQAGRVITDGSHRTTAQSGESVRSQGAFQAGAFQADAFQADAPPAPKGHVEGLPPAVSNASPGIVAAVGTASATASAHGVGASIAAAVGRAAHISSTSQLTVDATVVRAAIANIETITRRISESPADIRDAARAFSQAFADEVANLRRINDWPDGHEQLIDFFETMAAGLAELASALDDAVEHGSNGQLEPVFLGTAGKIVGTLQTWLTEWLEENRSLVIGVPIRIALFGSGVAFLHSFAADSAAAIAALTTLVLKRTKTGEKKKGDG